MFTGMFNLSAKEKFTCCLSGEQSLTCGLLVLFSERQRVFEQRCIDVSHDFNFFQHSTKDLHIKERYHHYTDLLLTNFARDCSDLPCLQSVQNWSKSDLLGGTRNLFEGFIQCFNFKSPDLDTVFVT